MADKKYVDSAGLGAVRDWADDKFQPKLPEISATDNGKVLSVVEGQWEPTELQEELPEVTSADNGKVLAVVAGEWEKAEAPDGLPPVQSADNGKVLTVVEGEWAKADVPDELPAVTSQDNGKVLGVVEGQWAKTEPEDGLPEVTSSDNGKVLSVVEGEWAPAEPTGGSGLPEVTSEDNGDILSVVNGAWAKSEPGYRVETVETEIIPVQSVTTAVQEGDSYARGTTTDFTFDVHDESTWPTSINVTLNGTEYNLPQALEASSYGELAYDESEGRYLPDFTNFPCVVSFFEGFDGAPDKASLATPEAGTYTIKADTPPVRDAIPSSDFKLAVNNSYMETTETEKEAIPEQSITTAMEYGFNNGYTQDYTELTEDTAPETLRVMWNGAEYTVPFHDAAGDPSYGEFDGEGDPVFTTYPFALVFYPKADFGIKVQTPEAGTYTLSATYTEAVTAPTEKFKEAVNNLVWTGAAFQIPVVENLSASSATFTCEVTDDEIFAAIARGQPLLFTFNYHGGNDSGSCPAYVWDFNAEYSFFSIGADFTRLSNNSIVSITFSILKDDSHQCTYAEASLS